jgi:hypothetical protein
MPERRAVTAHPYDPARAAAAANFWHWLLSPTPPEPTDSSNEETRQSGNSSGPSEQERVECTDPPSSSPTPPV